MPFGTEKLYAPLVLAVNVWLDDPVNWTVAPLPPVPLIVPLIMKFCAVVKFAVAFAPFTVTDKLGGVNEKPLFVGVTVYVPFANPENVYPPKAFAVTVAVDVPLRLTVAPLPPVPLIVPLIMKVCAVELKFAVAFAPFNVMGWFTGVKEKPFSAGVTT
jgi:hypothetical protein